MGSGTAQLKGGAVPFFDLAKLHPKQRRSILAMYTRPEARVLAGGSGTGGKSYGLRAAAIHHAMWLASIGIQNPVTLFGSSTYEALRDRHFSKFVLEWGEWGELRTSDKVYGRCFRFNDPHLGAIAFRNLEDPNERRGSEFMAGFLDETTENTRDVWGAFCYMVRYPGLPFRPILTASNPDGIGFQWCKTAWRPDLYDSNGAVIDEGKRSAKYPEAFDPAGLMDPLDYIYVPYLPEDNPTFDEGAFWAGVAHLPHHIQRARRYGLWTAPEGARWPFLEDTTHRFDMGETFPNGIPSSWPKWITIDYGLRAPYCCLWGTQDYDGDVYIYREDYQAGLTADLQAKRIAELTRQNEVITDATADPAMWQRLPGHTGPTTLSTAEMYESEFVHHPQLPNSLIPGINKSRIMSLAAIDKYINRGNRFPNLWIERSCMSTWAELTGATFARGSNAAERSEDIDPRNPDHAITALYYRLQHILEAAGTVSAPMTPIDVLEALRAERDRKDEREFARFASRTNRRRI